MSATIPESVIKVLSFVRLQLPLADVMLLDEKSNGGNEAGYLASVRIVVQKLVASVLGCWEA